jgi:glycosyltransferase involved in cell wall biosynthesis
MTRADPGVVGVDVRGMPRGTGGIRRYGQQLVTALQARSDVSVTVRGGGIAADLLRPAHGADVVHSLKHVVPLRSAASTCLTVHDTFLLDGTDDRRGLRRVLLPPAMRRALERADALVCVSGAVRERLAERAPHLAERARVIPHAVPDHLRTVEARRPATMVSDHPYVLMVAGSPRRKRIDRVLDALDAIAPTELRLVVAGTWTDPPVPAPPWVEHVGAVDDSGLRWLYEHARATCVPSESEGFGLPVVESRLFGTPVLVSNDTAVFEAGEGHVHVVGDTVGEWTGALRAVAEGWAPTRPEPPSRTWADVAGEHVQLYRELSGG